MLSISPAGTGSASSTSSREAVEDPPVVEVQATGRDQGERPLVGAHDMLQVGSEARATRSLARQRPRVGPMLPTGMLSALDTTA